MDDDLDFSNDNLLRRLQEYRKEIDVQLDECRANLQATVDQISWIENKREIERQTIEKEFEKIQYEMQYILDKRKKQVLLDLDKQIDLKRSILLARAKSYQSKIIEAAELQPNLISLENFEKTIHSNILQINNLTKEKGYSNARNSESPNIYGDDIGNSFIGMNDDINNNSGNISTRSQPVASMIGDKLGDNYYYSSNMNGNESGNELQNASANDNRWPLTPLTSIASKIQSGLFGLNHSHSSNNSNNSIDSGYHSSPSVGTDNGINSNNSSSSSSSSSKSGRITAVNTSKVANGSNNVGTKTSHSRRNSVPSLLPRPVLPPSHVSAYNSDDNSGNNNNNNSNNKLLSSNSDNTRLLLVNNMNNSNSSSISSISNANSVSPLPPMMTTTRNNNNNNNNNNNLTNNIGNNNNNSNNMKSSSSSSSSSSLQLGNSIKSRSMPLPSPSPNAPQLPPPPLAGGSTLSNIVTVENGVNNNPLTTETKIKSGLNDNNNNNNNNSNNNNSSLNNNNICKMDNSDDIEEWSKLRRKRFLLEIMNFLDHKPMAALSPSVQFSFNRNKFIKDIEFRINKFGYIYTSTGSSIADFTNSVHSSIGWLQSKTIPIINVGNYIAKTFGKSEKFEELQEIAPPLLIVYLGIEKSLAEIFVENFLALSQTQFPSGVVIPIIDYNNEKLIEKWLNPQTIGASNITTNNKNSKNIEHAHRHNHNNHNDNHNHNKKMGNNVNNKFKDVDNMANMNRVNGMNQMKLKSKHLTGDSSTKKKKNENGKKDGNNNFESIDTASDGDDSDRDYAYEPLDIHDDVADFRPVLRVVILLYNSEKHDRLNINCKVSKWHGEYNLRAISCVELRRVTNSQPIAHDSPNCYIGCIFYDDDGIVDGQDTIFDSIAQSVFSPQNEHSLLEHENENDFQFDENNPLNPSRSFK